MLSKNILKYIHLSRESKDKLVAKFYKHAWPFRRNKTLMFGFMYIEKGLSWYKKILNLTLPEPRDIKINPKNCIGKLINELIRGLIILVLKAYQIKKNDMQFYNKDEGLQLFSFPICLSTMFLNDNKSTPYSFLRVKLIKRIHFRIIL